MAVWFVRVRLASAVDDELSMALARNFGQCYVDKGRNLTEVTLYTAHVSITAATTNVINALYTFVRKHGCLAEVDGIEVMTRERRVEALADEGITEESIMNLT